MNKNRIKSLARGALPVAFLLFAVSVCAAQNAPAVLKVEPPNWWAGHSINPVRVLIRGKNLAGARVEAVGAGLKTGLTRINSSGTYLFVDVVIDKDAKPGRRALRITNGSGATDAPFEISAPLARAGRFQGFSPDDVVYLIMPDRFSDGDPSNNDPPQSRGLYDRAHKFRYHGGDLQGIINHLPYLKDLGVTAIWLTPWYDNVNHPDEIEKKEGGTTTGFHGYGAIDFYGVEEHFGTLAKLRELVDEAHKLGIKVIQDEVRNHTGPYHPWVEDSPTPTWYNGTKENHLANVFQTWVLHDPRAEEKIKRETMEGWFLNFLPDLNQSDEEVERYLIQNTLWWIGVTGIDGIREDTWQYVPNSFWQKWTAAIKREYPSFRVFGEVKDGDVVHVSFFQGGRVRFDGVDSGLDSLLDFPLFYPIRRAFAEGKDVREVAQALSKDYLYTNPDLLVTLLGGHDDHRFMSEKGATITGLKLAHTFLLTTRGVPQLYYGDEIAMTGEDEPTTRKDFPGGFPGDKRNAFTRGGRTPEEQDLFTHVRRMARLHGELEPLRRGSLVNLHVAAQQYAYARVTDRASVIILINNDTKPAAFDFEVARADVEEGARFNDRLDISGDVRVTDGKFKTTLPARSASVFTLK
ncbi:MAG TPA: alpha-amylase family glycosyl hydrolase [Pyrinomonadaceae bacterium]